MKIIFGIPAVSLLMNAALLAGGFERRDLSVTVYNQNMALVRDVRSADFSKGINSLKFTDVASSIIPESVLFKPLKTSGIDILEQNYEYDLVSPLELLGKYIDKKIKIRTKDDNIYEGLLSSFDSGQVILTGENGRAYMVNRENVRSIEFPKLPEGLITKPTLVWKIKSPKSLETEVELNYIANDVTWRADYAANISADDSRLSLNGWVTINNNSGTSYENAVVKLIAGDVRREMPSPRAMGAFKALSERAPSPKFKEKSFFEYHMYTLAGRATLKNRQQKQIALLSASGIPVRKVYEYRGATYDWYYYDDWMNKGYNRKVNVKVKFRNSKKNGLGMPLPKGKIRVYKMDSDKTLQFIGEDSIDHTPRGEELELLLGSAFDVKGERKITAHKRLSPNRLKDSYRIILRNHKKKDIVVNVIEKQWGDWKITDSNYDYRKEDAFTAVFPVRVRAKGKAVLNYTAEYLFR